MDKKMVQRIIVASVIVIVFFAGIFLVAQVDWQGILQGSSLYDDTTMEVKEGLTHDELTAEAGLWGIDTSGMTDEQINAALKDETSNAKGNSGNGGAK